NPGATDFLRHDGLFLRIASKVQEWSAQSNNCGLVVGATQTDLSAQVRAAAPDLPFLIPGVGAQGGSILDTARATAMPGEFSGLIFHVTRGILPDTNDRGDIANAIATRTDEWNARVA